MACARSRAGAPPPAQPGATAQQGVPAAQAVIGCPDAAKGSPGSQVNVPVSANPADGGDAFDLAVAFNQYVISAVSVTKTPLSAPLTLTYNVTQPGQVRISLFGTAPIYGSGPLVNIQFNVVGPIGDQTVLDVFRGDINERAITSNLDDGLFTICDGVDHDGDGYSGCQGDCNDADPTVYPGAKEICDGRDNNCNGQIDEGFDVGAPCSAGLGICQRSGQKVCSADHKSTVCNAVPGAPQTEVCNGLDDDCDGTVDNHIPVPADRPGLSLAEAAGVATLSWTATGNTTKYDVQRGGVRTLVSGGGSFAAATDACLANDLNVTTTQDSALPQAGDALWYLVRAENCAGNGTFNDAAGGQQGDRDTGIAASPNACP